MLRRGHGYSSTLGQEAPQRDQQVAQMVRPFFRLFYTGLQQISIVVLPLVTKVSSL
jgi:hypothetical protein